MIFPYFLSLILIASSAFASSFPLLNELAEELKKNDKEIIDEYFKVHRQFTRHSCRPGTEERFNELDQKFRSIGFFVPVLLNDELDVLTIAKFLPEIREKHTWILQITNYLESLEDQKFQDLNNSLQELEVIFKGLIQNKAEFYPMSGALIPDLELKRLKINSRNQIIRFREAWENFVVQIPFLLSYKFPVDHFELRRTNDHYRSIEGEEARKKANQVFFLRQILQDGAQEPNRVRSDAFLRSVIDRVTLDLARPQDYLSEELRYDLDYLFSGIRAQLRSGKRTLLPRLKEWNERTQAAIEFYDSLLEQKGDEKSPDEIRPKELGAQMASRLAKARFALQDFSLHKMGEVYRFWREQSPLNRALFSLETILYNEVADLDGREALERRDIVQVVINRIHTERYSHIGSDDPIFSHLALAPEVIANHRWLNALFKRGEFSFTYFFIRSNVRIFCPETTRRGRFLLRENLAISLDRLRNPDSAFDGLRYFSRHSMQGRIDMSEIWSDYKFMGEIPGPELATTAQTSLNNLFKANNFTFLYRFSHQDKNYDVLEMRNQVVLRERSSGKFHSYRNPHFFRYYRER